MSVLSRIPLRRVGGILARNVAGPSINRPIRREAFSSLAFPLQTPHRLRPENEVNRELDAAAEEHEARVRAAIDGLVSKGFSRRTIWRQDLCWGDHDTFQHVNNVRYVRWYESARMRWGQALAQHIDDEKRRNDILRGTGVSFILGGINVRYRRPLFEDRFTISAVAYSVSQSAIASSADQLCVMYDYVNLKKCPIPEDLRQIMEEQGQRTATNQSNSKST
ncbi:hypothetical protein A4X09_0g852 [Tilletia walkeri]|uniref:Thioesterase domain-containing protein n=1 Tax=Tilletia walkeri TaxID=117179 RepID=A0A8X7NCN4_9BASI|nr:hypothetical protein A4X09_0g852 [Tilletia walkeri]